MTAESTFAELVGRHEPPTGDIGLEIEVEGRRLPVLQYAPTGRRPDSGEPSTYWTTTRDGSLRGREAWEYIFVEPLSMEQVNVALEEMRSYFKSYDARVDNTMRAGVHVHINVNNMTPRQIFTFATAYYLLEEILTANCGFGRQGNHHALRLKDAYNIVSYLCNALSVGSLRELNTNDIRYAALNWNSLFNHGSIEFRQKGTNECSFEDIYEWVNVLWLIKENSIANFSTPADLVAAFSGQGGEQIVRTLIPDMLLAEKFVFAVEGWQASMRDCSRLVQDFAFIIPDVEAWRDTFTRRRRNRSFEEAVEELRYRQAPLPSGMGVNPEPMEELDSPFEDDEE